MIRPIYSVRDNVAEVFNKPFPSLNDADAIRAFEDSLKDNPRKTEYTLYYLGDFNDTTGDLNKAKEPHKLFTGFDIKEDKIKAVK